MNVKFPLYHCTIGQWSIEQAGKLFDSSESVTNVFYQISVSI